MGITPAAFSRRARREAGERRAANAAKDAALAVRGNFPLPPRTLALLGRGDLAAYLSASGREKELDIFLKTGRRPTC